jgi:hypothetical protein
MIPKRRWMALALLAAVLLLIAAGCGGRAQGGADVPASDPTASAIVKAEAAGATYGSAPTTLLASATGIYFPSRPSGRDHEFDLFISDQSCDQAPLTQAQEAQILALLAARAAWQEGTLAVAGLRSDSIVRLGFKDIAFTSSEAAAEPARRDLEEQWRNTDLAPFEQHIALARRGPCRTDAVVALREIQGELSSLGAGASPVRVFIWTNGITFSRGIDFYRDALDKVLNELKARGEIAHLPQVELVLVGVGRVSKLSARRVRAIQNFWFAYGELAGAQTSLIRDADALIVRLRGGSL